MAEQGNPFRPHEEGPLFADSQEVDDVVDSLDNLNAVEANRLDTQATLANIDMLAAESFAKWLSSEFPEEYGGDKTPDIATASAMLKELKLKEKQED